MERAGRATRLRRGYGALSMEGKATRVGASEAGRRASFNNRRDQRHAVDSNGRTICRVKNEISRSPV
jgi:hypothetical protein